MPIFSVKHTTVYRYSQKVSFREHRLMRYGEMWVREA
jgi:hypothetical protein